MATALLAPAPAMPKFAMERTMLRTMSERRPSDIRKSNGSDKPRYSTTTLKYSQMPLPTPPDSADPETFQLQFTLMPPTPAENTDPVYLGMQPPKKKRRSIQVPYLLTVQDIVEDVDPTEAFSPSSTNYSAVSEFGPFSMRNTMDLSNAPPLPDRASMLIKKRSPLAMQTSAADFDREDDSHMLKPLVNTLVTSNLPSEYDALYSPVTPVTPNVPFGPVPTSALGKPSLAERRARKVPAPLANKNRSPNGSNENLPTSPPPLTARSFAQAQAAIPQSARSIQVPMSAVNSSGLGTPQTATFFPQQKAVQTPCTPSFPKLPAPQTPMSATFFSPRSGAFPPYIPHSAAIASPRNATFLPIHEDVDRDALKSPRGVNMLVEQAQVAQVGFTHEVLPAAVKERFEMLWQFANAQADIDEVFSLEMFRQDSFTFTGAEHYTFGPDFTAPFYRISAHPSHEQDAIFSDLKIHRCSPYSSVEIPVIHLQLEAPTVESSGVVALIYPQVAGLMLEDGNNADIKKNPKMDVAEEKECCRLVYEVNKGFALYHPFKGEDGGWLNIEVEGRVGFDAIGANGTISLLNPATDESLVSLDFATCELFINSQACKAIPSMFIVDVAVATVLTVATIEGRRLRVIQEDLDQILAYEMTTSPRAPEEEQFPEPELEFRNASEETLAHAAQADYSFATAVGRMGATIAVTEGQKIAGAAKGQDTKKQSGMSKFGKSIANAFRRMFRKMARKPAESPEFEQVSFAAPQWQDSTASNSHVFTAQRIMVQSRI